jgi:hypothetical protein
MSIQPVFRPIMSELCDIYPSLRQDPADSQGFPEAALTLLALTCSVQ